MPDKMKLQILPLHRQRAVSNRFFEIPLQSPELKNLTGQNKKVYMQTIMMITENNFLFSISVIRKKAFSFLRKKMAEMAIYDIPPSFGDILYIIKTAGCVSIKDICRHSRKDKSTVSLIVNSLKKNGYITKTRNLADNRSIELQTTPKADSIAAGMMKISHDLNQQLFYGMSQEEKSILFMLLGKINRNLKMD